MLQFKQRGRVWWYDEKDPVLAGAFGYLRRLERLEAFIVRILSWGRIDQPKLIVGAVLGAALIALWAPLWLVLVIVGIVAVLELSAIALALIPRLKAECSVRIRRGNYGWAFMLDSSYEWRELNSALQWYRSSLSVMSVIIERPTNTRQPISDYLSSIEVVKLRVQLLALGSDVPPEHPLRQQLRQAARRAAEAIFPAPLG